MTTVAIVLAVVAAVLGGVIAVLKVVAPMTKTTVDDKALEYAQDAETVVEKAQEYTAPAPVAPATK